MRAQWLEEDSSNSDPEGPVRRGAWLYGPRTHADGASTIQVANEASSAEPTGSTSDDSLLEPEPDATPAWAMPLGIAGGLALFSLLVSSLATGDTELLAGVGMASVLAICSAFVFKRIAKFDQIASVSTVLFAGLSLKLLGTLARFYVGQGVYERSDATEYDAVARQWATNYLHYGQLPKVNQWTSTNLVKLILAELYSYVTPSMIGGYIVFSWLSFWGAVLAWRGFKRVYPSASKRYGVFILFAPSMMYWPSGIGKEAIAIFGLGLAIYGTCLIISGSAWLGTATAVGGGIIATYIRPHIGLVVMLGMAAGLILRKRPKGQKIGTLFSIIVFALAGSFVVGQVDEYFGTNVQTGTGVVEQGEEAEHRTTQGGSEFEATPVFASPANFPQAFMTVMFRPYPWEATSLQELLTAIESFTFAALLIMGIRRIFGNIRRDRALMIFAIVTMLIFVALFSNFANFGILARQRTQLLPFMFLLLCIPERPRPESYKLIMERMHEERAATGHELGGPVLVDDYRPHFRRR